MRQMERPAPAGGTGRYEKSATAKSQALAVDDTRHHGRLSDVDALAREFDAGYELGYDAGHWTGYGLAQYEITREWLDEIERSPKLIATHGPSLSELRRIRETLPELRHGQPCDCSRCGWVRRHGGDYLGGPIAWSESERVTS